MKAPLDLVVGGNHARSKRRFAAYDERQIIHVERKRILVTLTGSVAGGTYKSDSARRFSCHLRKRKITKKTNRMPKT